MKDIKEDAKKKNEENLKLMNWNFKYYQNGYTTRRYFQHQCCSHKYQNIILIII